MDINYIQIGQRIRGLRKQKGFSQQKLSEMSDLSPTYISYIENGIKCISLVALIRIANALGVSTDELLHDGLKYQLSNTEFTRLLSDCTESEKLILLDIATATKDAMRQHSFAPTS